MKLVLREGLAKAVWGICWMGSSAEQQNVEDWQWSCATSSAPRNRWESGDRPEETLDIAAMHAPTAHPCRAARQGPAGRWGAEEEEEEEDAARSGGAFPRAQARAQASCFISEFFILILQVVNRRERSSLHPRSHTLLWSSHWWDCWLLWPQYRNHGKIRGYRCGHVVFRWRKL